MYRKHLVSLVAAALIVLAAFVPAAAKGGDEGYQTGFVKWRAAEAGFSGWTLTGATLDGGAL
jgi:hypothetical protein